MNFKAKLDSIVKKNNSLVCVGLDSDVDKLPDYIKSLKDPQFTFNKTIVDATGDLVCAYKTNTAFYEAQGIQGISQLKQTIDYIRHKFPDIVIILDAKRADIGNTNHGYIKFAFDWLDADAITVHPYLGKEALKPYLDRKEKGIFVLCRTSNPGAGEFQDLEVDDKPFYQIVAEQVVKEWNYNSNCGLVIGATYPSELKIVRHIAENLPFLLPGIGAQGGDVEKTVKFGIDSQGKNAIINSSRDIIFASKEINFSQVARKEAEKLQSLINKYRQKGISQQLI